MGQHEEVLSQRRGRSKVNGDDLQESGSLRATLWQRILGTDKRFDETTSDFSLEMLPRIDRRLHSTRRGRGMDLPEKRGSTYKGGCADDRRVHSEEAGDDHKIRGDEEYTVYGKCKSSRKIFSFTNKIVTFDLLLRSAWHSRSTFSSVPRGGPPKV